MIVYKYDLWKKKKNRVKMLIGIVFFVFNIKVVMNMS